MLLPNTTREQKVANIKQGFRVAFWYRVVRALIVGAIAIVTLGRAALEMTLFQGQGVTTDATVIAIEPVTPPRSDTALHYRIRYTFSVDRRNYTGEGTLSARDGQSLRTMDPVPIRYLPVSPAYSIPASNYYTEFGSRNLALVVAFFGAAAFVLYRRRGK